MSVVTEGPTTWQNGSDISATEIMDQIDGGRHNGKGLKLKNNTVFLFFLLNVSLNGTGG